MNSLHSRHVRGVWCLSLIGIALILVLLMQSRTYAQNVSEWPIPGTPNIQGLDALAPENPYRLVFFTEYAPVGKIGMLTNISGGNAFLSEWLPIGSFNSFQPFKIVAGMWNFYARANTSFVAGEPYLNPPLGVKPGDVIKFLQLGFRLTPVATFTLPDAGQIGMLIPSPFSPGPDAFWLWTMPAGTTDLAHPWDIQRRSIGSDEVSAWVSNREPQQALYQFFPLSSTGIKWDLSSAGVTVEVFYVVPTSNTKGVTEIWIGGTHSLAATSNITTDCIAYMVVDKKNASAAMAIWDLPTTSALRTMNSIVFTHRPNLKTGFTNSEVWLSSSTAPEMTILKRGTPLLTATAAISAPDSVCFTTGQEYSSPNGVFWDDPSYYTGLVTAADNARRIWVTSQGDPAAPGGQISFLSANKGGVSQKVTFVTAAPKPSPLQFPRTVIEAERIQQVLYDSSGTSPKQDTIGCSIDRYIWSPPTLTSNFSGAMLDVDMQGAATPSPLAANGFLYTIIWHEPTLGRIGMIWAMPAPIATTVFDNSAPQSMVDEAQAFKVEQNYPNPFNPSTTIEYSLPTNSKVTIKVYNTLGQQVATLVDGEVQLAGDQNVNFNATNLPSGVYFYRIQADDVSGKTGARVMDVKKMILLK